MASDDLKARLRSKECCDIACYCDEAADCIESLEAEVAKWISHTRNAVWTEGEELKVANARIEALEKQVREDGEVIMQACKDLEAAGRIMRAIIRQTDDGGEDGKVFARDACIADARAFVQKMNVVRVSQAYVRAMKDAGEIQPPAPAAPEGPDLGDALWSVAKLKPGPVFYGYDLAGSAGDVSSVVIQNVTAEQVESIVAILGPKQATPEVAALVEALREIIRHGMTLRGEQAYREFAQFARRKSSAALAAYEARK